MGEQKKWENKQFATTTSRYFTAVQEPFIECIRSGARAYLVSRRADDKIKCNKVVTVGGVYVSMRLSSSCASNTTTIQGNRMKCCLSLIVSTDGLTQHVLELICCHLFFILHCIDPTSSRGVYVCANVIRSERHTVPGRKLVRASQKRQSGTTPDWFTYK